MSCPSQPRFRPANRTTAALIGLFSIGLAPLAQAAPGSAATIKHLEAENQALAHALNQMQEQITALQQEVRQLGQQGAAQARQQQARASQDQAEQQALKAEVAVAARRAAAATRQASLQADRLGAWDKLSLWGYGELYGTHPIHKSEQSVADLARAVFGIGVQFDDQTRFNSEYEVEHSVASADDPGEFEVEQFYVDRTLNATASARAGLFLIPAGLLNENHEPGRFYGVQRNFVETLIIPSTWREAGLSFYGSSDAGLDWNVGLTTGVDLSKWDFAPAAPLYASALEMVNNGVAPLQATHQEGALAKAQHLSQYLALNYRGRPGLTLGGSYFGGQATPVADDIGAQRVSLWEVHGRYQPGRWDLSALYAQGGISHAGAANALHPGTVNPLPSKFDGGYLQGAYNLPLAGGMRLAPFGRWERYDMGAAYQGIAPGLGTPPTGAVPNPNEPGQVGYVAQPRDHVVTVGANFYLNPDVVFKVDVQHFLTNTDFSRIDVGMGLEF